MEGESKEVIEARLNTLKHIKAFVEMNIKAREKELQDNMKAVK